MHLFGRPDPAPGELPTGGSAHQPPAPPPPPAPPAHAAPPAHDDAEAEPPTPPKWLPMRLQQAERTTLKKLGFESFEAAQDRLKRVKEIEDREEQTRLANLSELEREKAQRAKLELDLATERSQRESAEQQARLTAACAARGVQNLDYARYLYGEARKAEPTLTEADTIVRFLGNEQQRAALGVAAVPPASAPVNGAVPGAPPPPAPPTPSGAQPAFDASKATPAEWQAWRQANGLYP